MGGIILSAIFGVLGVALAVIGGVLGYALFPGILEGIVKNNVLLYDDTIQMERWLETPVVMEFSVFVFNVSNAADVLNGSRPILQEVGPYVYNLTVSKELISSTDDTLTYYRFENYNYDSVKSGGRDEDELLTVVNVAMMAIFNLAEDMGLLAQGLVNIFIQQAFGGASDPRASPLMTVSVRDLLFGGVRFCEGGQPAALCTTVRGQAGDALTILPDNTLVFSLFGRKNNTRGGPYRVNRGIESSMLLADIEMFENNTRLNYWLDPQTEDQSNEIENLSPSICNALGGTDTSIYAPFVQPNDVLKVYNPDLCITVDLTYEGEITYEGIEGLRFGTGSELFNRSCYCIAETNGIVNQEGCLLQGALELLTCQGVHISATLPHFLEADPVYRTAVIGLTPDPEKHRIFVELEPNTGTPLRGQKRAQINMFLRPIAQFALTQGLPTVLSPIVWIEEGVNLPDELLDEVRLRVVRPLRLAHTLRLVAVVAGSVIAVICLIAIIVLVRRQKATKV